MQLSRVYNHCEPLHGFDYFIYIQLFRLSIQNQNRCRGPVKISKSLLRDAILCLRKVVKLVLKTFSKFCTGQS